MAKCTKLAKPRPDFPLYAHSSGRWAKRIRGKIHYFGKWDDPQAALEKYVDEKDDLYAGRLPRSKREGLTVQDACNHFLHAKQQKVATGELSATTWRDYQITAKRVAKVLGRSRLVGDLRGEDFDKLRADFAKKCGLVALKNRINHVRIIFKYAYDAELIDRPVRFGSKL